MSLTLGSILIALAALVFVVLFIGQPFFSSTPHSRRLSRRQILLAEKAALIARIRELDFDHETEKIAAEAYEAQRQRLASAAAAVMEQLDKLADKPASGERVAVDDEIEKAVSRLRRTKSKPPAARPASPSVDDEIEAAVSRLRQKSDEPVSAPALTAETPAVQANGKKGRYCTACGQPADPEDRFCSQCGHKIRQVDVV